MAVTSLDLRVRALLERFGDYLRNEGDASGWTVRCPIHHPDDEIWATISDDGTLQACSLGCAPGTMLEALDARVTREPGDDDDDPTPIVKRTAFTDSYKRLTPAELTDDPPPLKFILKPYIPAELVSILSGPGGSNKTTLTTYMAVCRALGRSMFRDVLPEQGETVFLTTEDRVEDYRRKIAALRVHLGTEFDAKLVSEKVHFFDLSGVPVRLIDAARGEQFVPTTAVEQFADAIRVLAPKADHVVMETISRLTGGVETNSAMAILVEACQRVCRLARVAVTLIGHVSQDAARNGVADAYASRGGSAGGDNGRSSMVLTALSSKNKEEYAPGLEISDDDMKRTLVWTHPKGNGTPPTKPRLLWRSSTPFGPVLTDTDFAAAASVTPIRRSGRKPERTYAELKQAIVEYVLTVKEPPTGNAVIADVTGTRTTILNAIKELEADGILGRNDAERLLVRMIPNQFGTSEQGTRNQPVRVGSLSERERETTNQNRTGSVRVHSEPNHREET